MADRAQTYIDPGAGSDITGDGTIGNPYKTIQFALDNTTNDATNGNQFNIKAGSADILTASLDFTLFGTAHSITTDPIVFRGYTSAKGDGGIGDIDANANRIVTGGTMDALVFIDLKLHDSGATELLWIDDECALIHCELYACTASSIVIADHHFDMINCYVHNVSGKVQGTTGLTYGNYFRDGALDSDPNSFHWLFGVIGQGSSGTSIPHHVINNIFDMNTEGNGIVCSSNMRIINNTIFSRGSPREGIKMGSTGSTFLQTVLLNNYVEGFSGTSPSNGRGIEMTDHTLQKSGWIIGGNKVFNCAEGITYETGTEEGFIVYYLGGNEVLGASGLVDPANGDFTPKASLKGLGLPNNFNFGAITQNIDIGALQAASGGGVMPASMNICVGG